MSRVQLLSINPPLKRGRPNGSKNATHAWDAALPGIIKRYQAGETLQQIGDSFRVSREYIRQIMMPFGMDRKTGGKSIQIKNALYKKAVEKDARFYAKWGHDQATHQALQGAVRAWTTQRNNAQGERGLQWALTFAEWWAIWQTSGHWAQRGRGHAGYVMSRFGDIGPYAVGNVFIQRAVLNNSFNPRKKSGLPTGVLKSLATRGGYMAVKMIDGKIRYLGTFATIDGARNAYAIAPYRSCEKG